MKTQSQKINKNHWFLQCSRTCGDWDFRFYSHPNLHLTRFSFCLENDKKWGPRGLEILWKPIMSTKSFPKEEKNRQGCPKKPPGRLYGAPRWAQNAPKTSPGRLQDGFKSLLSEVASYIAFWTSKSTLKWSPKALQDASRTHLWEGQLRQANGKKKNSETDRKTVRQANNQQTNTRTNRPTDPQKEIERDRQDHIQLSTIHAKKQMKTYRKTLLHKDS